jgi:hypothetical protein
MIEKHWSVNMLSQIYMESSEEAFINEIQLLSWLNLSQLCFIHSKWIENDEWKYNSI